MKLKVIRILSLFFSTLLFLFVLFYKTPIQLQTTESIVDVPSKALKVNVKFTSKKQEQIEVLEPQTITTEHKEESKEEIKETVPEFQYIDNYLDLESNRNSSLVPPIINLEKIYSRIVYPASQKRKNQEAFFYVRVFVNKQGNISLSIPTDVNQDFVKSVQNAFKKEKAQPATLNNKPIDVTFTVPIQFSLY